MKWLVVLVRHGLGWSVALGGYGAACRIGMVRGGESYWCGLIRLWMEAGRHRLARLVALAVARYGLLRWREPGWVGAGRLVAVVWWLAVMFGSRRRGTDRCGLSRCQDSFDATRSKQTSIIRRVVSRQR